MGPPKLSIVLDSPTGSYYAGTNVTGRVLLGLDKQKKFRGLKIKFQGKAHVSWTGSKSVRKDDGSTTEERINLHADEEYFSNKYYLAGSANNDIEIPQGEHVYPFTTTLPPQLPTSFEGEHGHVRYTVTATLDIPWKMDIEVNTIFQVVTPLDLNYHAMAKEPVKKEEEKYFCCCCCKSGPLTLVACVPHTGYVPGQDIPVTIEVDNASNVQVLNIEMKIMKVLKWSVRNPSSETKTDNIELSKILITEGVECNGSKTVTQNINIPQMPFVNLDACSIINVSFLLTVTACVEGMCSQNLSAEIPLIMGTVPIYSPSQGGPAALPPAPGTGIMSGGDTNISPGQPFGGGYVQPGGMMPSPPPPGLIPTGGNGMAVGNQQMPQQPAMNGAGFVPSGPGQFGTTGGFAPPTNVMYPSAVYPNLNIDLNSPGSQPGGFRAADAISPTAPPPDSESAPLMSP